MQLQRPLLALACAASLLPGCGSGLQTPQSSEPPVTAQKNGAYGTVVPAPPQPGISYPHTTLRLVQPASLQRLESTRFRGTQTTLSHSVFPQSIQANSVMVAAAQTLTPVNATYSYSNGTFSITNKSGTNINIAHMEFTFSYSASISNFWGDPWMAWSGGSSGGTYTLTGGSTKGWPDGSVMTVIFTPKKSTPAPTNPHLYIVGTATPSPTPSPTATPGKLVESCYYPDSNNECHDDQGPMWSQYSLRSAYTGPSDAMPTIACSMMTIYPNLVLSATSLPGPVNLFAPTFNANLYVPIPGTTNVNRSQYEISTSYSTGLPWVGSVYPGGPSQGLTVDATFQSTYMFTYPLGGNTLPVYYACIQHQSDSKWHFLLWNAKLGHYDEIGNSAGVTDTLAAMNNPSPPSPQNWNILEFYFPLNYPCPNLPEIATLSQQISFYDGVNYNTPQGSISGMPPNAAGGVFNGSGPCFNTAWTLQYPQGPGYIPWQVKTLATN